MKQRKLFPERRAFFFLLVVVPGILIFTAIVMLLWNAILPEVVNVNRINYWQALGILVLSKILFGGFRGGHYGRRYNWRMKVPEKWATMTPEEKEKFKQEWQSRCGEWRYKWGTGSQGSGVKNRESGFPNPQEESLK